MSTRTAGFLGEIERGPRTPRVVTSVDAFTDHYGGATDGYVVAGAVTGFFDNGGDRCYVSGITGATDVAEATCLDSDGNPAIAVSAVGPGEWGTRVAVTAADRPRVSRR